MNSMGCGGLEKCFFSNSCTLELNFGTCHTFAAMCLNLLLHTFPVVQPLDRVVDSKSSIVTLFVMSQYEDTVS